MASIFISYARVDAVQATRMASWLREDGHDVFVDLDPQGGIDLGDEWESRLHERLRWADAVVCLLTEAYVRSVWGAAEIGAARSRGNRVFPVVVDRGVTHPLLISLQHADLSGAPAPALSQLRAALRRLDLTGGEGWSDDRSPFPGLRPFSADDHLAFFGRDAEIARLCALLRSPVERAEGAALLVTGPSGCGKSSLIRAGLQRALGDDPDWWMVPAFRPGMRPVAGLARELAVVAHQAGLSWGVERLRARLDEGELPELADELLLAVPAPRRSTLLIVIDQWEELLTQTPQVERARFIELLRSAVAGSTQVVGTLRSEFLDQILTDAALRSLPRRIHPLEPMGPDAIRSAIDGPARLTGISIDAELATRIVNDTGTGAALPLLAYTLAELADGVKRGGALSAARYDQLGGVGGTLSRQADEALAEAVTVGGRSRDSVVAGLLRLVTVDELGRPTRWSTLRDDLSATRASELDSFVNRRLLTSDREGGRVVITVAHEAFLTAWAPLADAIAANSAAIRLRRAVEQAAAEWLEAGRPPGLLWEGGRLSAAFVTIGSPSRAVPSARRLLYRRVRPTVADGARVELSSAAHDFLMTGVRRDRLRRGRLLAVLSVLLVLATVGMVVAFVQRAVAQNQQRLAISRQLIAEADVLRNDDPDTALRLGIAADELVPATDRTVDLVDAISKDQFLARISGYAGAVTSVAFSAAGNHLASVSVDGTLALWDLTEAIRPLLRGPPVDCGQGPLTAVAIARNDALMATGAVNGAVDLWTLGNGISPRRIGASLIGHTGSVTAVAISPDSHILATASADQTVVLWDVADPERPQKLGAPLHRYRSAVTAVSFSLDGRTLATAGDDSVALLWDIADPALPQRVGPPISSYTASLSSVSFAQDGRALATAGGDGVVRVYDITDRTRPSQIGPALLGNGGAFRSVAFSPDGQFLAAAGDDTVTTLWDVSDRARPRQIGGRLGGHGDRILSVVFSPDGHTLASAGADRSVVLRELGDTTHPRVMPLRASSTSASGTSVAFGTHILAVADSAGDVSLWDTAPATPVLLARLGDQTGPTVNAVALNPHGDTVATARADGSITMWDVSAPRSPRLLGPPVTGHPAPIWALSFAPDGRRLATASTDRTVRVWGVDDRGRLSPVGPALAHTDWVLAVAFSPDGRTLASGSVDGTLWTWDVSPGAQPGRLSQTVDAHNGAINSVAFSRDGHLLASGSSDGSADLWNAEDPARPTRASRMTGGHTAAVTAVAFSPDGLTVATASRDRTTRLWDTTTPDHPLRLEPVLVGHDDAVNAVAYTPDGRSLATAGSDGVAIVRSLDRLNDVRANVRARACAIVKRGLNADEWARYVVGVEFRETCT